VETVDRLRGEADGRVEPERAVGLHQIVVNRLRPPHQRHTAFEELVCDGQGAISANHDKRIEGQFVKTFNATGRVVLAGGRVCEWVAAVGRPQNGATAPQDTGDMPQLQHPSLVRVNQPVEAVLEAHTLESMVAGQLDHRADHRVETRRVATAGQHPNT